MIEQVASDLFRLAVPLPDSPLSTVNVYVLTAVDGVTLVDCGWDTAEAHATIAANLAEIGFKIVDIRRIVVTHLHPDHFGLASRLAAESGAHLYMHPLDAALVSARYEDAKRLVDEMEHWLRVNGVPAGELAAMAEGSLRLLERVGSCRPDTLLDDGASLRWGGHQFDVLWVPGHSPGLICLHDRSRRLLLSSDHVLRRISPHVGLHVQSADNPLGRYLDSLRRVRDLPVVRVLPGHGHPFVGLAGRVDEIMEHHQERCSEITGRLDAPRTGYEVATALRWKGSATGWNDLAPFQRRMALTETLAHLEFLRCLGTVDTRLLHGVMYYEARRDDPRP